MISIRKCHRKRTSRSVTLVGHRHFLYWLNKRSKTMSYFSYQDLILNWRSFPSYWWMVESFVYLLDLYNFFLALRNKLNPTGYIQSLWLIPVWLNFACRSFNGWTCTCFKGDRPAPFLLLAGHSVYSWLDLMCICFCFLYNTLIVCKCYIVIAKP